MGEAEGWRARELYDREPTFRAGITAWVEERRCDLRLVDLLLEYGLTTQAECARWAATEPDRPFAEDRGNETVCGPFPSMYGGNFYWYGTARTNDSHDVPQKYFGRKVNYSTHKFQSAADAILFLLDNWKPDGAVKQRRRTKQRATATYFFTKSLNALQMTGAASGPTLFSSPYCAFFSP